MTRWVVTGAAGMLGADLVALLQAARQPVAGFSRDELDVTNPDEVRAAVAGVGGADVVVNAAAYTRVDDAESHEQVANAVNGHAPGMLAAELASHSRLIHVSTDYVFAGDATEPYEVDDPIAPRSAYGRSKAMGEAAALQTSPGADVHVVRTAWLYGEAGPSFVRTVGRRLRQGEPVDVVNDQRGAPTWTRDLATRLIALGTADVAPGIWHCSAGGEASWFDVAVAIAEELGVDPALVHPTTSATLNRPAPRPAYSVLSNRKWAAAGLPSMPHWRDALHEAFATLGESLTD
ncbi:MAG TPA: dTDP-4-dehydrorhamnose reductase [Mycobacteriales bacterium]|nr:dTDP-4-dehydrorhamnose reductase [Mycobacteriales bacterium]